MFINVDTAKKKLVKLEGICYCLIHKPLLNLHWPFVGQFNTSCPWSSWPSLCCKTDTVTPELKCGSHFIVPENLKSTIPKS